MQLALILAVVATFLLADAGPAEAVDGTTWRVLSLAASMAVAPLVAWAASLPIAGGVRREGYGACYWRKRYTLLRQIVLVLWVSLALGGSYLTAWPQVVRHNWGLAGWFLV